MSRWFVAQKCLFEGPLSFEFHSNQRFVVTTDLTAWTSRVGPSPCVSRLRHCRYWGCTCNETYVILYNVYYHYICGLDQGGRGWEVEEKYRGIRAVVFQQRVRLQCSLTWLLDRLCRCRLSYLGMRFVEASVSRTFDLTHSPQLAWLVSSRSEGRPLVLSPPFPFPGGKIGSG